MIRSYPEERFRRELLESFHEALRRYYEQQNYIELEKQHWWEQENQDEEWINAS